MYSLIAASTCTSLIAACAAISSSIRTTCCSESSGWSAVLPVEHFQLAARPGIAERQPDQEAVKLRLGKGKVPS